MKYSKQFFEGGFGLERETLRVTADGRLARTPHPFDDPHLDRDFCENQLEIITPVGQSVKQVLDELERLSEYAEGQLDSRGELLWFNSNPPRFDSEEEINIAHFSADKQYKNDYRRKLCKRYGKRLMLYSGIHFNFSFSESFLRSLCGENGSLRAFKDSVYLRLFKYASRYSWLLVLLTAASPLYDLSLEGEKGGTGFDGYASRRSGEKGYWNSFVPALDYSSLESYAESVKSYIQSGELFSAGELYLPVRIKSVGENSLDALVNNGVDHIELRMFDLNPLAPQGIFAEDLEFAHYFLMYLFSLPDFEFTPELQAQAIANHKAAAGFYLDNIKIGGYPARQAANGLLDDMEIFFEDHPEVLENISLQRAKLAGGERYSDKLFRELNDDFHNGYLSRITEERRKKVCASCSAQV